MVPTGYHTYADVPRVFTSSLAHSERTRSPHDERDDVVKGLSTDSGMRGSMNRSVTFSGSPTQLLSTVLFPYSNFRRQSPVRSPLNSDDSEGVQVVNYTDYINAVSSGAQELCDGKLPMSIVHMAEGDAATADFPTLSRREVTSSPDGRTVSSPEKSPMPCDHASSASDSFSNSSPEEESSRSLIPLQPMASPVRLVASRLYEPSSNAYVPLTTPAHSRGRDWFHAEWWTSLHSDLSPNVISATSTFLRLKEDTETDDRHLTAMNNISSHQPLEAWTDVSNDFKEEINAQSPFSASNFMWRDPNVYSSSWQQQLDDLFERFSYGGLSLFDSSHAEFNYNTMNDKLQMMGNQSLGSWEVKSTINNNNSPSGVLSTFWKDNSYGNSRHSITDYHTVSLPNTDTRENTEILSPQSLFVSSTVISPISYQTRYHFRQMKNSDLFLHRYLHLLVQDIPQIDNFNTLIQSTPIRRGYVKYKRETSAGRNDELNPLKGKILRFHIPISSFTR